MKGLLQTLCRLLPSSGAADRRQGARFRPVVWALEERLVPSGATGQPLGPVSPEALTGAAESLVAQDASSHEFDARGGRTFCSGFLRAFAFEALGTNLPELQGQANQEFDKLEASPRWEALHFRWYPDQALADAQLFADEGYLVVVAYRAPNGSNGHVAVVVPGETTDLGAPVMNPAGGAWGRSGVPFVPVVAQAGAKVKQFGGQSVFAALPFNYAFSPAKKSSMEVFVLNASPQEPVQDPTTFVGNSPALAGNSPALVNDPNATQAALP